ncbi:MAG: metallophosphoesterase [Oceanipulchritudo sp.]
MTQQWQGADFPSRWESQWIERRQRIEARRLGFSGPGTPGRRVPLPLPYRLLRWSLRASGLYPRGYRNFQDLRLTRRDHSLNTWPTGLDGYRILQVSDLHIDLDPALMPPLRRILAGLRCDLAVFTGDYCEGAHPTHGHALRLMREVLETLPPPVNGRFGVLGNHDTASLGAALEEMGLPILVNEAVTIERPEGTFALAGIDDPYLFRMEDVFQAAHQCPDGPPRILLSHSPQVAPVAQEAGFHLMLSGHTHGGQVCLPGGLSLVGMEAIPRSLFRGPWRHRSLTGYTTTGTGACHIPVRYNCPPEVVLHVLHPSP